MTLFRLVLVAPILSFSSVLANSSQNYHHAQLARNFHHREINSPSSWSYIGCVADPSGGRAMASKLSDSSTMTPNTCMQTCINNNYSYAGIEYGRECWCSNTLNTPIAVPESSCSIPCSGDSSRKCGAGYTLSLFGKYAASTYSSVGCFSDSASRTLPIRIPSTAKTPALCQRQCALGGYAYAGMEAGSECYCGSAIGKGGVLSSASKCNQACNADSTQTCGGAWYLDVYSASASSSSSSASATTTTYSTASLSATSTSIATSVFPFASTFSSSASLPGWTPIGCYNDGSHRALSKASTSSLAMTPAFCQKFCSLAGYAFAGVEYAFECYCGSTNAGKPASPTQCNVPCSGDSTAMCGGPYLLNVFQNMASGTSSIANTMSSSSTTTATTISTSSSVSSSSTSTSMSTAASGTTSSSLSSSSTCSTTSSSSGGSDAPNVYSKVGCYQDSFNRVLPVQPSPADITGRTTASCWSECSALGYAYAGLEAGSECWCGNTIAQSVDSGVKLADASCSTTCTGAPSTFCGGAWGLMVYYNPALDSGSCGAGSGSSATTIPATSTGSTSAASGTPTGPAKAYGKGWTSYATNTPGKYVVSHMMVGNCYSYTSAQWLSEIRLASAQGIDAFALNLGQQPDWQPARMADAYDAALASGTGFKMFLSFDMSAISCSSWSDTQFLTNLIVRFGNHAAQLKDLSGNAYVSTFSGEYCYWGQGSITPGWVQAVKTGPSASGVKTKFLPSFFTDSNMNPGYSSFMDGMFPWNNGWPMGNYDISWSKDAYDLGNVDRTKGQVYMAPISPWFFTHYSPSSWNKNWIYRGDDWLYVSRWEDLTTHRSQVDLVEIITWNDYGESSYISPIGKDQPNSNAWVDGFPHTAWLTMTGYYAAAYKTGVYPTIVSDTIYMWARPHGTSDSAPDPACGRPNNADWTSDMLWVVLFSTGPGTLSLTQGPSSSMTNVVAGVNKIKLPSGVTNTGVTAVLRRNGMTVFTYTAPITFTHNPSIYNFNAFVFNGP